MNEIKKISIITLTYNNGDLLEKAITSVKNQKISENIFVEYIVLDDCSKNFEYDEVKYLLDDTPFQTKIILNIENIGTVKSFNKAIFYSSGEIIIPLSADDEFYDENVVSSIVREFELTDALIITGIRMPIQNNTELKELPLKRQRHLFKSKSRLLKWISHKGNIISGASTYYNRDVFSKIGMFDEKYQLLEDYPFYIKALLNDIGIHFYNNKVIKYGSEGISAPHKVSLELKKDFIKVYREVLSLEILSFRQQRYLKFLIIINSEASPNLIKLLSYPEQCFYALVKFFIKGIINKFHAL